MAQVPDPYLEPGTGVLRNLAGLRDPQALATFEFSASVLRLAQLKNQPLTGRFDLEHLCAIHRHVFQDVYPWAGEVRTTAIAKGGSLFAVPGRIEASAAALTQALARDGFLRNLDKPRFVEGLARHFGDWNALHPFREGNGRATRAFFGQLASQAGYELDLRRVLEDLPAWNEASKQSFLGRHDAVAAIFSRAVRPARAVAFESLAPSQAVDRYPELELVYRKQAAISRQVLQAFPGDPGRQGAVLEAVRAGLVKALDAGLPVVSPGPQARAPRPASPTGPSL